MASTITAPSDSSNRTLQDRFNQELAKTLADAFKKIADLEARVLELEFASEEL